MTRELVQEHGKVAEGVAERMTTITAPDRSTKQRMDALEKANEIRSRRAQLKRDLKAGRATAMRIIKAPPEWVETMKVFDLLLSLPKVGRVKANKWLNVARVSPAKTVGGLTERQRNELLEFLK